MCPRYRVVLQPTYSTNHIRVDVRLEKLCNSEKLLTMNIDRNPKPFVLWCMNYESKAHQFIMLVQRTMLWTIAKSHGHSNWCSMESTAKSLHEITQHYNSLKIQCAEPLSVQCSIGMCCWYWRAESLPFKNVSFHYFSISLLLLFSLLFRGSTWNWRAWMIQFLIHIIKSHLAFSH